VSALSTRRYNKPLRVIVFTWEFPPRVVGELASRVNREVNRLCESGVSVDVITISDSGYLIEEPSPRLRVTRINSPVSPHSTIITWLAALNVEFARFAADIYHSIPETPILHTHDWHFAPAAATLKNALGVPWAVSIHSLEAHRSITPNSPLSLCISTIEKEMSKECDAIFVASSYMRDEVLKNTPADPGKILLIPPEEPGWSREVLKIYRSLVVPR
jgi:glycosyltransferase involved in cell wall biosynthesis